MKLFSENKRKSLLIFLGLFFSVCVFSQIEKAIPEKSNPPKFVNDFARLLTSEQKDFLEQKLIAFDDSTSNQVAIIIVESLKGYEANEYATALGRKWGVGGKEFNNGVIILVSTGANGEKREVYLAPGYGLEGAIPDITAKQIIENEIIPNFKNGDYFRGFNNAIDAIEKATIGEYKAPKNYSTKKNKNKRSAFGMIFLVLVWIILGFFGGGRGRGGMFSRRGYGSFVGPTLLGSALGGGGFSSGSSGGGFGGFGGGSFGGGGSGGSW